MNQKKYGYTAMISLIIGVLLIDSPVRFISLAALLVMGICTVRGKLWDWKERGS